MQINEYCEKITEIQNNLKNNFEPEELTMDEQIQLITCILDNYGYDQRQNKYLEDRAKQYHQKQMNDNAPPTEKQKEWLRKKGKNPEDYKTKREASDELAKLFGDKQ